MALTLKDVEKIDEKLTEIYKDKSTTNISTEEKASFVDRSESILEYMNFVAINNKSFLNLN